MARCAFICACKLRLRRSQQQQQRLLNLRQREAADFISRVILHWHLASNVQKRCNNACLRFNGTKYISAIRKKSLTLPFWHLEMNKKRDALVKIYHMFRIPLK